MSIPVKERPGYREHENSPISRAVGKICREHRLTGAVLITFDVPNGYVGASASGQSDLLMLAMDDLGLKILGLIDDGTLRPFRAPSSQPPRRH